MLSFLIGFAVCWFGIGLFLQGVAIIADFREGFRLRDLRLSDIGTCLVALVAWPWMVKRLIEDY